MAGITNIRIKPCAPDRLSQVSTNGNIDGAMPTDKDHYAPSRDGLL